MSSSGPAKTPTAPTAADGAVHDAAVNNDDSDIHNAYGSGDDDDFTDSADEWERPCRADDTAANGAATGPQEEEEEGGAAIADKLPGHLVEQQRDLLGAPVPVTFTLPSGESLKSLFYMGQTVDYLKVFLAQHDPDALPYSKTALYLGDKVLFNPLSLNDLPFKAGENNDVRVELQ